MIDIKKFVEIFFEYFPDSEYESNIVISDGNIVISSRKNGFGVMRSFAIEEIEMMNFMEVCVRYSFSLMLDDLNGHINYNGGCCK